MLKQNIHQGVRVQIESGEKVYQPGLLTETICNKMIVHKDDVVVDVGCGTGYIGITAFLLGAKKVYSIDPCDEALKCTLRNAGLNNISNLSAFEGCELEPFKGKKADLIITLPPQMPFSSDFNSERYGGIDGTDVIIKIIKEASVILKTGTGRFYLIHSALANPGKVRAELSLNGFKWQIIETIEKELNKEDMDLLTVGLFEYILDLYEKGLVELSERDGRFFYPVWFYMANRV